MSYLTSGSYVDNNYGLNKNKIQKHLDADIAPDMSLEWMRKMAERYPIDMVGEYYGITKDNKSNIKHYIGKGINNEEHINIVENHFEMIGMPIPGGLKWFEQTTLEKEPIKVMEDINKQAPVADQWIKQENGTFLKASDVEKEQKRLKELSEIKPVVDEMKSIGSVEIQPMTQSIQPMVPEVQPLNTDDIQNDRPTTGIIEGPKEDIAPESDWKTETSWNTGDDVNDVTKARKGRPAKKNI